MIDYTKSKLEQVSVHRIGNKTNGEELHLSKTLLDISDSKIEELLSIYFISPFSDPEFHSFTFKNEDFTLNPLFNFACGIFDSLKTFHSNSVNVAKHLYDLSVHPQIKSGDLFVAYFTDILMDDELTDAIAIYESENKHTFLKLDRSNGNFSMQYEEGISIKKPDKGCLILNTCRDSGFKICMIDNSGKSGEARYWKDSFLQLKPCNDDYHYTKEFLSITKNFVAKHLSNKQDVTKTDQIDLLNRSVDYFKSHDSFDKKEFETEVLKDTGIIKSFQNFDSSYRKENDLAVSDKFEISQQAVKNQARIFKSVLELDKNFHIYIHGNRELIQQGVEKDGRKFYKIYYREEK